MPRFQSRRRPLSGPDKLAKLIDDLEDAFETSKRDPEVGHGMADDALLEYIDNPEVTRLWERVKKWFA